MSHSLWFARALAVVTTFAAALINTLVVRALHFDPIQFAMWFVLPVGAIIVGGVAVSGYVLGCRRGRLAPHPFDLQFLMALCLTLPLLTVGMEYLAVLFFDGVPLQRMRSFADVVAGSVTESTLSVTDSHFGTASARVGEFGWFILVPRLAALLAVAKIAHAASGGGRRLGARAWGA
jgi:hypothetical protein